MRFHRASTDSIAKERLKIMMETEQTYCSQEIMSIVKKEIADVIRRHFEIAPEEYEIKVILKEKRA